MKLWLLSQGVNDDYDTYDRAVVASETAEKARNIHPGGDGYTLENFKHCWAPYEDVTAEFIGMADDDIEEGDVICASFNAG